MDLLKVLIADDEESIRTGLKFILNWEKCGCKIVGEADSGLDALNKIRDFLPEIITLDIKMPGCSGIETLSKIRQIYEEKSLPFPSVIIISGYSEFEFAQDALNFGAKAYLLKPIDEEKLEQIILKSVNEINEKKKNSDLSKSSNKIEAREYLLKLIQNEKNLEIPECSFFKDSEESFYSSIIFFVNVLDEKERQTFKNSIENHFSFFEKILIFLENKIILFLKTSNENAIENCIERSSKISEGKTFISKGSLLKGISGIKDSFLEAKNYENSLFYAKNLNFLSKNQNVTEKEVKTEKDFDFYIEKIVFYIETYDKKNLEDILEKIDFDLRNPKDGEKITKKNLIYILVELRNRLISKYPEREISDGEVSDVVPSILEKNTFDKAFIFFKTVLNKYIENFNFNTSDSVIVKVIAYIKANFHTDLKLEILGDMFNCNSAYLGKKFKKYTGVQFNTYLDNLRIEEAKNKLENTDLKIYQISKIVGYANTDYFFMKFKKSTGLTPKEFKKKVLEKKGISFSENSEDFES